MYNAEQKTRFIKERIDSVTVRDAALSVFNATERFEREAGKDIVTMDASEFQAVFDKISGIRDKSKSMPRHILRSYSDWALENGIPDATNAARQVDSAGIQRLKTEMLRNPKQLQVFLDQICVPESEETNDNAIRSFYWLAYSGIEDTEVLSVRVSEPDFSNMVIRHGGEEFPIYREAIPALKNCVELKQFRYDHPNFKEGTIVYRDRVPGDVLLRGYRSVPSLSTFRVAVSQKNANALKEGRTEMNLSYFRVWISGVFYRMYEDELAGIPVNFDTLTMKRVGNTHYKLSKTRKTPQYKIKELSREYRTDYERWKQMLTI